MEVDVNLLLTKVLLKHISVEEAAKELGLTYEDFVSVYMSGDVNKKKKE